MPSNGLTCVGSAVSEASWGCEPGSLPVDALRAQLALAQKRAAMGSEFRQLSESYKAKVDRLSCQLSEERTQAQASTQVWKDQMASLRSRARSDKEALRLLEMRVQAEGGAGMASPPSSFRPLRSSLGGSSVGTGGGRTPETRCLTPPPCPQPWPTLLHSASASPRHAGTAPRWALLYLQGI